MRLQLQSISLGFFSLLVLGTITFLFQIRPDTAPFELLVVMIVWAAAVGIAEKSGGLAYLIRIAIKLIKRYPNKISFIGPIASYMVVLLSGVYNINTSILKAIIEVGQQRKIEQSKLEKILATSIISALDAQIISPISIVMTFILNALSVNEVTIVDTIKVLLPATIGGTLLSLLATFKWQKLPQTTSYQYLYNINREKKMSQHCPSHNTQPKMVRAKSSLLLLIVGNLMIIWLNTFTPQSLIPTQASTFNVPTIVFVLIILSVSALIILIGSVKPAQILKQSIVQEYMQLLIDLIGIIWLFNTLFYYNAGYIPEPIKESLHKAFKGILSVSYAVYFLTKCQIVTVNAISNNLLSSRSIAYLGLKSAITVITTTAIILMTIKFDF